MIIKCPCGKKLRATHEQMGKKARCPSCKRMLRIPVLRPAQKPEAHREGKLDIRRRKLEVKGDKWRVPITSRWRHEPAPARHHNDEKTKYASQDASPLTTQSPNMHAWPFPKVADRQELEDRPSQVGSIWSRSIIEDELLACPNCQKRVPGNFNRCSHCGEYFDESQQKDDLPNRKSDVGRSKLKLMSALHKVFRRGAA